VRVRHLISRGGSVVVGSVVLLMGSAGAALSQQVEITPKSSITPSSHITSWVFQIAIAAAILAVLVLIGFLLSYLRFAPKFFGREEKPRPAPPGTRPATLTRQAAAVRWTPSASAAPTEAVPAPAGRATATAVAERPAPAARSAQAEAPSEGAAAAAEATTRPTAGPSSEPAVQADAVGTAEAAAPEPRPSAKTPEEVAAPPAAAAPAAAQPAAASHGAALDQETFDRVLEEQLAKGVDRRVAEGRARAAAVVAARKKGQG
jgi:hypothetical protein